MKLLAVNGSPRKELGNTAVVLEAFLEGVRRAGGVVDLLYTADLDIGPCASESACWLRTPGVCVKKDDMEMVLGMVKEADVLVLAAPVYVDSFPGPMKTMLDRMIAAMSPFIEVRDGRTRHPLREGFAGKKAVLVSVCGLYELENCDVMTGHFRAFCANFDTRVAGMLLRPHGGGLTYLKEKGRLDPVLEAFRSAGRELVEKGEISEGSEKAVCGELFTREQYLDIINSSFRRALDRL